MLKEIGDDLGFEILESYWFTPTWGSIIGIIKVKNEMDEIKYYIGNAGGQDKKKDEEFISIRGAKFPKEAAEQIFK